MTMASPISVISPMPAQPARGWTQGLLRGSAAFWWLMALLGQWAFFYDIAAWRPVLASL